MLIFLILIKFTFLIASKQRSPFLFVFNSQAWDFEQALIDKSILSIKAQEIQLNLIPNSSLILNVATDLNSLYGAWTLFPLINQLTIQNLVADKEWFIFLEANVDINLENLFKLVEPYKSNEEVYFGRGLSDIGPTVIHHYYGFDGNKHHTIMYPDLAVGIVMSKSLLNKVIPTLKTHPVHDFSIDAKFEFAKFLQQHLNVSLVDDKNFCLIHNKNCITTYNAPDYKECPITTNIHNTFIAIKTHSANHGTRIPIIKKTWLRASSGDGIVYFSDEKDDVIPTESLMIPNTIRGHCAKTLAILKYFITNDHDARWLIVADDDSMMSLDRLYKMLNCMNWNENVILGERYGYGFRIESNLGYDYPTGGAGMTFSRSAAKLLVQECKCPANDSPDDMIIGMCARSVKIKIIHSDAFHQARPRDYSDEYLKRIKPISFHKFEDQDSVGVYFKYLENDVQHNEL